MRSRRLLVAALCVSLLLFACSQASYVRPSDSYAGMNPPAAARQPAAKSLILFIGDGMGPEILSIAKVYSDKATARQLSIVVLANTGRMGMATTYSADKLVTDSAAGATALATGTKTNNGVIGMGPDGTRLTNLFEKAVAAGKSVGVVTTTSVTDATPAGFLAHVAARRAEFDVAAQIAASNATVIMGGGKGYFLPRDEGRRNDGRNLVDEAKANGFGVVFDKDGLAASEAKRVIGLFADDDMPFEGERKAYETPSLAEMFDKAMRMLTADPDGFVLVVEGGRIDHAEHENKLGTALGEMFAFDAAIAHAMDYQQSDSTLTIVVTADHDTGAPALTTSNKVYPPVDSAADIGAPEYEFIKWISTDHTGAMVPVVARGPGERLFSGIHDNTDLDRSMVTILGL
jgi:alkaline phosphatase